ncbi:hypothetical protein DFH27DRAFT_562347 [Peziza echinospora]|nr:hypothetical protein DFH27DRAFT_562347 [Peziza echinospora]
MFRSPSSHHSSSSPESGALDSPDESHPRTKKRKSSDTPDLDNSPPPHHTGTRKQQPKKTAHNMIEKRYRTNLNDKIAALRDAVPSLRVMAGTSKLGDDDEEEDLEGLTPAHKLNKATVLAKATEYIRHLEKRSKKLAEENEHLKNRLSAFEKLATMGGAMSGPGGRSSTGPGGGLMSRLMVGSLAGLMVANGLQEQEGGTRGLFAIPVPFSMPFDMEVPPLLHGNKAFWLVCKVVLLFTAVMYVFAPGFFDSKPQKEKVASPQPVLSAVPSLAAPVEVRRRAWLTAVQTVSVPRNSVMLELAALGLKFMKLGLRQLVGWDGYALITGTTIEHEEARVKAWTIALDAQLAGGDENITHARLLLSLLASFTLPATPARLMLNSLHIRLLFWDLNLGFERYIQKLAAYYWSEAGKLHKLSPATGTDTLPDHLARLLELDPSDVLVDCTIQRAYNLAYNRPTEENSKMGYLDEGMNSVVLDLAIRSPLDALAAWHSSYVLHQAFIGSLKNNPQNKLDPADTERIEKNLDLALRIAPPTSGAQLRVLASRAVLLYDQNKKDLSTLINIFKDDFAASERVPAANAWGEHGVQHNRNVTVTADIKVALRCAMTLAMVKQGGESRKCAVKLFCDLDWSLGQDVLAPKESAPSSAAAAIAVAANALRSGAATPTPHQTRPKKSSIAASQLGLLGFVVAWKTLTVISNDPSLLADAQDTIEKAAGTLRRWIGSKVAGDAGVETRVRMKLGNLCTSLAMKMAGMEAYQGDLEDAGYVSGGGELTDSTAVKR